MAFGICFTQNDMCDVCRIRDERPTIELVQSSGRGNARDYNCVIIHEDCLMKKLARLKQVEARKVEVRRANDEYGDGSPA